VRRKVLPAAFTLTAAAALLCAHAPQASPRPRENFDGVSRSPSDKRGGRSRARRGRGRVSEGREADATSRGKVDEALGAFGHLLAVSRGADSMGTHWRVAHESWRGAQEAWEKSSATLPPPVKGLRRCAVPLAAARGMIERADDLFRQSKESPDPFDAAQMLARHERLLRQAQSPLRRAERCYRAVRNASLKGRK
jgi:hypothetical protein